MGLDFRLTQNLSQKQILAPQILQSVELLQLSTVELANRIQEELDTNEFLEVKAKELPSEVSKKSDDGTEDRTASGSSGDDSHFEGWESAYSGESSDFVPGTRSTGRDAGQDKIEAMNNAPGDGPTLQEELLRQFDAIPNSISLRPLAEQVIFNLDYRGWLNVPLEDACALVADRFSPEDAARVLSMIQGLEPKGVGARNMSECLLLQLDPSHPDHELRKRLLVDFLDDVLKGRVARVTAELKITQDRLRELLHGFKDLNLRPGASVDADKSQRAYVNPDLMTEWDGETYDVVLVNDWVPQIRVAKRHMDALLKGEGDKAYLDYARRKYESARALVEAVRKRKKTLLDVGRILVARQKDFLDHGPQYLKPLRMQEVAEQVHVHTSTISRAVSGKYIQTHRGIFPLKDFFAGGTTNVDGSSDSRESVKMKVKEIIEHEGATIPLSDDEIVQRLLALHGVKVARRTVTKYRKALGIAASRHRKTI